MESKTAVEHVQEQLDLLWVSKVACHRLKHPADHHNGGDDCDENSPFPPPA